MSNPIIADNKPVKGEDYYFGTGGSCGLVSLNGTIMESFP